MMPAPLSCTSSLWINHQAPGNHNVTAMWGAFFPETMEFCPFVFGRHLQLEDIALFYFKYPALASWDMAGSGVELDWAITNVPVGHWSILTVWGTRQGHILKGEGGKSVFQKAQCERPDPWLW